MASGYDSTKPTRQSFAFNVQRPSQSAVDARGGFRGAQVSGGETQSGFIDAPAGASGVDGFAQLGGFFNQLMQPYVERKKKELFIQGVTDQMSAAAGEEIRASNSGVSKIFGPTAYEEGAIFYSAKEAVNNMQADMLGDMDNLKRLPPQELSKVFAGKMEALKSGDRFTDMAVDGALLEASGPMLGAIAKERFAWQQDTAKASYSAANDSAAGIFQTYAAAFAATSDPSDEQSLGMQAATNNYLTGLQKPVGMTDASWKDSLVNTYKKAAQSGNGFAVTALKQSGFLSILNDEERIKLEDAEFKHGNRALGEAAMAMGQRLDKLRGDIALNRISSVSAMAEGAAINEQLKRTTGFDMDLMDYKELGALGGQVWSGMVSSLNRQQDHQWQLEKEAREKSTKLEEAQTTAAQVIAAMSMGDPIGAKINGIGDDNAYNAQAERLLRTGDFGTLARTFTNGYVSSRVKDLVQGGISAHIGKEYSKSLEPVIATFQKMNAASPSAAAEYYGPFYPNLLSFQRSTMDPKASKAIAWADSFGNPAQFTPKAEGIKNAEKDITGWIDKNLESFTTWGGFQPWGTTNLNASSKQALTNAMSRQVASTTMAGGADVPSEAVIADTYRQIVGNGSFERYGQFGWGNAPGTVPLAKSLNLEESEANEFLPQLFDAMLKKGGYKDGASGQNYRITRQRDRDGTPLVILTGLSTDGTPPVTVPVRMTDMQSYTKTMKQRRVSNPFAAKPKPSAAPVSTQMGF